MYTLEDFRDSTVEQRHQMLEDLAQGAQQESSNPLREEIAAYETKYEMSSEEMKEKLATGELEETPDISEWVYLLNATSY